jgi:hypothetical protein
MTLGRGKRSAARRTGARSVHPCRIRNRNVGWAPPGMSWAMAWRGIPAGTRRHQPSGSQNSTYTLWPVAQGRNRPSAKKDEPGDCAGGAETTAGRACLAKLRTGNRAAVLASSDSQRRRTPRKTRRQQTPQRRVNMPATPCRWRGAFARAVETTKHHAGMSEHGIRIGRRRRRAASTLSRYSCRSVLIDGKFGIRIAFLAADR